MVTRRRFLQMAGAGVASAATAGLYTWQIEPGWLEMVRRVLPIAGLPASWHGRTLVQMSDIHVGPRVSDDYVRATFAAVAALQPDLVVITGDFMSYRPGGFEHVARLYAHVPRGRFGTLAVLGNHDYGVDWQEPHVAQMLIDTVSPHGITVLRNEAVDLRGLQVIGLDDLWAKQFRLDAVRGPLDRQQSTLVLSHNPDTVDLTGWGEYRGWILSGHTHGGQCKPPFLPPPILPVRNRRYTAGEFALDGGRRLYVNRGVGHVLKVRFNVRPEVTVFELRPA